ncbi:DUF1634 domain-containing protein [Polyangium sp. y55x31]|uniref:DUF1634 domain-containing protein n=1 Tax=Polyangium sp. y55x31 TaxID=3042688 RepID=UPI00248309EF|nr:DUF1634 domain-containing protein [Polyangium sp. y55x31]MDI1476260.1 DUF1634 domain-containing protein [Polyangium sp. y55x31]
MKSTPTRSADGAPHDPRAPFDMEALLGKVLLLGVLASLAMTIAGLVWQAIAPEHGEFERTVAGVNLYQFILESVRALAAGELRPSLMIDLGITIMLLTPYARVLASMVYFAFVDRNPKYTVFTGFVLGVLTYSLFLR